MLRLRVHPTLITERGKEDTAMTSREQALTRTKVRSSGRVDAAAMVRAGFSRTLTWFDGVMLGGATPRSYRREGYPEIELHQLIAGRKNRLDGE
jgi:hypothetical protein